MFLTAKAKSNLFTERKHTSRNHETRKLRAPGSLCWRMTTMHRRKRSTPASALYYRSQMLASCSCFTVFLWRYQWNHQCSFRLIRYQHIMGKKCMASISTTMAIRKNAAINPIIAPLSAISDLFLKAVRSDIRGVFVRSRRRCG